jgi:hypothetical protein
MNRCLCFASWTNSSGRIYQRSMFGSTLNPMTGKLEKKDKSVPVMNPLTDPIFYVSISASQLRRSYNCAFSCRLFCICSSQIRTKCCKDRCKLPGSCMHTRTASNLTIVVCPQFSGSSHHRGSCAHHGARCILMRGSDLEYGVRSPVQLLLSTCMMLTTATDESLRMFPQGCVTATHCVFS